MNFQPFNFGNLFQQTRQALQSGVLPFLNAGNTSSPPGLGLGTQYVGPGSQKLSLANLFNNDQVRLTPQQVSIFLKETLKLPNEMRLLLLLLAMQQAAGEKPSPEMKETIQQPLKELLEQLPTPTLPVPMEKVQELLQTNTKEAKETLMKLLQGTTMSQTQGGQQVAELTSSLTKLAEKIQTSPKEAMETLMLLYIPWYPLALQQKLEMDFEQHGEDGGGGGKEQLMVLFLETNTMGRFKITVTEHAALQLTINVIHEEIAKSFLPHLEELVNQHLATEGLPAAIFEASIMQAPPEGSPAAAEASNTATAKASEKPSGLAGFKNATRRKDQKQISAQQGSSISLLVFNTAYVIARLIFEADEQNRTLQQTRKNRAS